jgi:hypothetical protein
VRVRAGRGVQRRQARRLGPGRDEQPGGHAASRNSADIANDAVNPGSAGRPAVISAAATQFTRPGVRIRDSGMKRQVQNCAAGVGSAGITA